MRDIQIRLDDFSLDETISADETAIMYRQQPLNQYVPTTAERAVAERADGQGARVRLTAMLWGTAAGKMGPLFAIIKCSAKGADLRGTAHDGGRHRGGRRGVGGRCDGSARDGPRRCPQQPAAAAAAAAEAAAAAARGRAGRCGGAESRVVAVADGFPRVSGSNRARVTIVRARVSVPAYGERLYHFLTRVCWCA